MRIYLAARYSRRLELCGYREQLRAIGHTVDARWLNGDQINNKGTPIGDEGEALVEGLRPGERLHPEDVSIRAHILREKFARDDFEDVISCHQTILFTEPPRSTASRGGRMVEFGMALADRQCCWIVGPRENIFCWLEAVRQFDTWEDCFDVLQAEWDAECKKMLEAL